MSEQDVASIAKAIRWNDFADDDLLPDRIAARLLNCSVHTLRRWRISDPPAGPRFARTGALIRYRLKDLRTFIDRSMVMTTDDPEAPARPKFRRAG